MGDFRLMSAAVLVLLAVVSILAPSAHARVFGLTDPAVVVHEHGTRAAKLEPGRSIRKLLQTADSTPTRFKFTVRGACRSCSDDRYDDYYDQQ